MKIFNYKLPENLELVAVLIALVCVWCAVDYIMEVCRGDSKKENN